MPRFVVVPILDITDCSISSLVSNYFRFLLMNGTLTSKNCAIAFWGAPDTFIPGYTSIILCLEVAILTCFGQPITQAHQHVGKIVLLRVL